MNRLLNKGIKPFNVPILNQESFIKYSEVGAYASKCMFQEKW